MDKNNNNANGQPVPIANKSKATLNGTIDFSKEIKISQVFADANLIAQHKERLTKGLPNITPQMLDAEIVQIVVKDNLFSAAMNEIVKYFNFDLDNDFLTRIKDDLKKNLINQPNIDDSAIAAIADKILKKQLVFNELAKLWKIVVSDEEVKDMLDIFYKRTNQSIREVLDDKTKFDGIREAILEEKLILKTIAAFPIRFTLVNPNFKDLSAASNEPPKKVN